MSKELTVSVPDETFEALRYAARDAFSTPEELASATITARYGQTAQRSAPSSEIDGRDVLADVMRVQGHLAELVRDPENPEGVTLPPVGSQERERLEAEIAEELSDALDRSGLTILDLIDRR